MHSQGARASSRITLPLLALILTFAGCGPHSEDVLGEAYVAPGSINLRRELAQRNSSATVLKHGDRVGIVDVRRRFVKVRTAKGVEGWIDSSQLLSPADMEQIRREHETALALPSEGSATVYEALNIHIEPNRQSPAVAKIPEAVPVAVLAHRIEPKTAAPPHASSLIFERPQLSRRQRKEKQAKNAYLPPMPPPPKPPDNWQELSAERIDGSSSTADLAALREKSKPIAKEEPKKPVVMEDWSLVRTKNGETGWVLTRNLTMSIPDEVAQYAEGKRISSYFDLGSINDEEKGVKHNWLWTTSSATMPYDFDGWRVFLWNRRRHRYETSYRERDVEGYFPVRVDPADPNTFGRTFQLVMKDDDGKLRRRSYLFDGVRVHLTGKEEYHPGASGHDEKPSGININQLQAKIPQQGWMRRQWNAFKRRIGAAD
ncbi:MAG: SH3 domain-containing protein [Acidobacteriaceae bacterium]|nr:SH3 domain-containing protein [Acidobacteriaceae bacterium]MBV9780265.1 SH3 domain-containing protein [Acidobacteriaceae bacterium]